MTTTPTAIRGRVVELIRELVPTRHEGVRFVEHRSELDGDFQRWVEERPAACFRRYQVRDAGTAPAPDISTTSIEACFLVLEILVAYPHTSRLGPAGALDRDDTMRSDQRAIEAAIGIAGGANFDGVSGPRAEWLEGAAARAEVEGADVLVMRQTMRYRRAAVLW